jgi:hypothetical protein
MSIIQGGITILTTNPASPATSERNADAGSSGSTTVLVVNNGDGGSRVREHEILGEANRRVLAWGLQPLVFNPGDSVQTLRVADTQAEIDKAIAQMNKLTEDIPDPQQKEHLRAKLRGGIHVVAAHVGGNAEFQVERHKSEEGMLYEVTRTDGNHGYRVSMYDDTSGYGGYQESECTVNGTQLSCVTPVYVDRSP